MIDRNRQHGADATPELQFVRDDLREHLADAIDTIIACWDEWESDASQDAQVEQDNEAWFDAMNQQLAVVLVGMLERMQDRFGFVIVSDAHVNK